MTCISDRISGSDDSYQPRWSTTSFISHWDMAVNIITAPQRISASNSGTVTSLSFFFSVTVCDFWLSCTVPLPLFFLSLHNSRSTPLLPSWPLIQTRIAHATGRLTAVMTRYQASPYTSISVFSADAASL